MRRLTFAIISLALIAAGVFIAHSLQETRDLQNAAKAKPSAEVSVVAELVRSSGNGNRFVAETLETLERRINIVAKVRQRVQMGESELTGTGQYWQQGAGNQRRTRWELQTLVAGEQASLLQVFDSRHLWTDLHLPSEHLVTQLDLQRLQREIAGRTPLITGQGGSLARTPEQLARAHRGGLTQLFNELVERFDFDEPRPMQMGELSVFALVGHWKPEQVASLWPKRKANDAWPEALPHHVLLMIGQTDLFPYLIEYRRGADAALATGSQVRQLASTPLTRYELYDVQFARSIDPKLNLFAYTPGESPVDNVTKETVNRLSPKPVEPEPVAQVTRRTPTVDRITQK